MLQSYITLRLGMLLASAAALKTIAFGNHPK